MLKITDPLWKILVLGCGNILLYISIQLIIITGLIFSLAWLLCLLGISISIYELLWYGLILSAIFINLSLIGISCIFVCFYIIGLFIIDKTCVKHDRT